MTNHLVSNITISQTVSVNEDDVETLKEINEEYKKLNEKCDKVINKIKNRKEKNIKNG